MGDGEKGKFDLYKYIPPPPPLMDVSALVGEGESLSPQNKEGTRTGGKMRLRGDARGGKSVKRSKVIIRDASQRTTSIDRSIVSLLRTPVDSPSHDLSAVSNASLQPEAGQPPETCHCPYQSEPFSYAKSALPKDPLPIPLSYWDFTDRLFETGSYAKYPCVFRRQRLPDYRKAIDRLLDPTAEVYSVGETVTATPCLVHSPTLHMRLSQQAAALQHSEFTFDSLFEGGNLDRAVMVQPDEFHLFLTPDCNTKGYMQWFYFAVRNEHRGRTIKIHLVNFTKCGSPFARDMKPSILSISRQRAYGTSWTRGCYDIRYSKNTLPRSTQSQSTYFTLYFSYTFLHDHDTVYFAYSEPYTFTRLTKFLTDLKYSLTGSKEVRIEETMLAQTVGGLQCPIITVTDHSPIPKKKIGVTARVHPGETVGSFMAEGFIRFVTSTHPAAAYLRRICSIVIIPMLNPDGVVMGNTRTGLVGVDLNRKWDSPDPLLHPVIMAAKQTLSGAVCFIDLHGHSKKDSSFTYGNSISRQDERFWASRFLPIALAKLTPHFTYPYCFFFNSHSHDKAARTVMFTEKGVLHSFTLEASFNGCVVGDQKVEFDSSVLRELGRKLGEAIYGLISFLLKKSPKETTTQESVYTLANQMLARLSQCRNKPIRPPPPLPHPEETPEIHTETIVIPSEPVATQEKIEEKQDSDGSESDPECDELPQEEKISLNEAIQRVINTQMRKKGEGGRKIQKCGSKVMGKDPVERVVLRFLGPSQTANHLQKSKPFLRKRYLEDESPDRGSRSSLMPPRKTPPPPRHTSHSPDLLNLPKSFGFESYLQLVRQTRHRTNSRFPLL